MDIAEAFQIVLDVAKANAALIPPAEPAKAKQEEAIRILEDLAVNEYGDD